MLVNLNVHEKYKIEIERLLEEGHILSDVITSYEFLNENYGKMEQIQLLTVEKESGKTWNEIFKQYMTDNPVFEPRSFDSDYLLQLMSTPEITPDDIMIADRVSQNSITPFETVINNRIEGNSWKEINAGLEIVNGSSKIPHVPVTAEQLDKYSNSGLYRRQIVESLVTAWKIGRTGDEIINKVKAGSTTEDIYAEYYTEKYY